MPLPNWFYCLTTPPLRHPHLFKPERFSLPTVHSLRHNPNGFVIRSSNIKMVDLRVRKHREPIICCYHSIQPLLNCIVFKVFVSSEHMSHKAQVHEATLIKHIPKKPAFDHVILFFPRPFQIAW